MALAVVDRAGTWRPAATGAELPAVTDLVDLVGDGAANPPAAQVRAVPAGGLRLVSAHSIGTDARPVHPDAGHTDFLQHRFELRRVPTLPSRHHDRDVVAAENLTPITWTRGDGYLFSDDPADWIEYDKRQFRQILGRLTRVITGTLDPHLARYPDDEWAQLATAQLTGVRATLAQLSK
ncbi:hypothetical protein ACFW5I_29055 [Streptomyces sp. NPDC058818]|uniref:hypothetical protein n=1 Tax=Streptomyces sp. NPDC058818 TaxID=3346640 RepID=UPI003695C2B6